MSEQSYTTVLTVQKPPRQVFDSICDVRGWWGNDVEGRTDAVGAEFTFRGQDQHRAQIKVTELVPGERVVYRVLENYFAFATDQDEWKDNELVFEISPLGEGSEMRFTQVGLVPEYECFEACSNAWGSFIGKSLRNLIATGQGEPMAVARGGE